MTQGPLPIILLAANDYPDRVFREHLWSRLDGWVDGLRPMLSYDLLNAIVSEEKGTVLEPFTLSTESKRIALFLARVAFSKKIASSRFRIVSEETLGNAGGLVITSKGKSFYSERFQFGKNRLTRSEMEFFAPSMKVETSIINDASIKPHGIMHSDDKGMYLDLPVDVFNFVGWIDGAGKSQLTSLATRLEKNSTIGPKNLSILSAGLGVEAIDEGIRLSVKSPEALIRFTSYVVQSQSIYLSANERFDISLLLPSSAEGSVPVTIIARDEFAHDWMNIEGFGAPTLERNEIEMITEWSFQHKFWLK